MSLRLPIILTIRPGISQKKPQQNQTKKTSCHLGIHCTTGKNKDRPLLLNPVQLSLYRPFSAAPSGTRRASLALPSSRDRGHELAALTDWSRLAQGQQPPLGIASQRGMRNLLTGKEEGSADNSALRLCLVVLVETLRQSSPHYFSTLTK